jgi:ABC-type nitrate/sulfonate/bicarbonate transport system substrate-binding protein
MKKAFVLIAAVLTVLTGCGREKRQDGAITGDRKELETIVFASPIPLELFNNCPFYAADHLGYFAKEGLKIQFEEAFGTADAKMVSTGNAQFAYPSPGVILTSIEAGMDIKAVFNAMPINIFGFAARKGVLNSPNDLKGKTIALGDASWKSIGSPIIKAIGLDPENDVTWVTVGDARYQATATGRTDTLLTWDVEFANILGLGYDLDYFNADNILPELSNPVIVNSSFINEHPDIIVRFNRAVAKGIYFSVLNPQAAADIVFKRYPALDFTFEDGVRSVEWNMPGFIAHNPDGSPKIEQIGFFDERRWEITIQALLESGDIKNVPDLSKIYTNEFIDDSWSRTDVENDARNYQLGSDAYVKAAK